MEKHFNGITLFIAMVGGAIAGLLGGLDQVLHTLLFLMGIDYLTGLMKAIRQKRVSSEVGFLGILKKGLILVVIAIAVELERLVNESVPFREMVIMFYIANEGISLVENLAEFVPMPAKLKEFFLKLREDSEMQEK